MSNKIKRCRSKNITNNKICHNKNIIVLNYKPFCTIHYKYYINYYATIIQRYYKGYKQRKTIKNIYNKLPIDLQKHIIYFIRQDHYYNKYKKIINKIIQAKINTFLLKLYNLWYTDTLKYISNNFNYVINIYTLYAKYHIILNKNITKIMYQHFTNIRRIFYLYNNTQHLTQDIDPIIINNIEISYFKLAKLF
tara:strand:+ start:193 stop:771 length:579 start_codon:yes stop_codon:yes gene_type:complete